MDHAPLFVGIDVSKAHLDVAVRPAEAAFRTGNDPAGLAELVARRVRPRIAFGEVREVLGDERQVTGACGCPQPQRARVLANYPTTMLLT